MISRSQYDVSYGICFLFAFVGYPCVCVPHCVYNCVYTCIHKVKETQSKISVVLQMSIFSGILLPLSPSQEKLTLSRLCQRAFWLTAWGNKLESRCFRATSFCATDIDILLSLLDSAFSFADENCAFFALFQCAFVRFI